MKRYWLVLLLGGMTSVAAAQVPPAPGTAAATDPAPRAEGTTVAPRPPTPLRRARVRAAAKPPPLQVTKEAAQAPPPRLPSLAGSLAPVPNRSLEAPRVIVQDRTRLGPSVINRNLPGRGQAADGAPSLLEDKLFRPAPGARLNVPFSY